MKKVELKNQPVGPFPAMLVGAMVNGKPTYTAVGAGGCACLDPVLCVSLKNTHYITGGIIETGYFSVNIPSSGLIREMDFCGMVSGRDTDKSDLFTPFFDPSKQAPMIEECPLSFVCRVCDSKEIRGFTMFFGEITSAFACDDCVSGSQVDPLKLDPIIMMGFNYCSLKEVIGQPFAEGKKLERFSGV